MAAKSKSGKTGISLSKNAKTVLERRYLKKDQKGQTAETPEKLFQRVANHIASASKSYNSFLDKTKPQGVAVSLSSSMEITNYISCFYL